MQTKHLNFLHSGGECGAYIRSLDWQKTLLGNPDTWPISLLSNLSLVLDSRMPMFLYWGPEHICFYNDAFRPSLGATGKHPNALGQPAREVWQELGNTLYERLNHILTTGETTWNEDVLIPIFRNDSFENVYWTYSSSVVKNDDGEPYGVLTVCTETTNAVLSKKKLEETNEWLQITLKAGDMGTWDVDTSTYKFHSTGTTKQLFNLPKQEEVPLPEAMRNIHNKDRDRVMTAIYDAIQNGNIYDTDYTIVMPDNTERIINAKGKLYYTGDGVANRFAGIMQDVTEEVVSRQQQQRLVSLVENSNDYMSIAGLDGKVMYLNKSGRNLVGLSDDIDVTQLHVKDFHTPESYTNAVNQLRDELAKAGKWTGNIILRHFITSEEIPCLANAILINDPQTGQLIARGITLRDLRPERMAQKALRESQERLSLALQATNLGAYDWLINEDTLSWDERCRQLFGITNGEAVTYGNSFLNGLHPDDRPVTEAAISDALNPDGPGLYSAKYRTVSPEGKFLHWVQATGRCLFDENRKPVRLIGTVLDITEQINAQEEVAEREEHFRLLIDAISQLVWIADTNGNIVYVNKSIREYTPEANNITSVSNWASRLHPSEQEAYLKGWQEALTTGKEWMQEHRICHQNNEYRWHLTRITPYHDTYSNIEFWVSTSTNIQLIKDQAEQKNDFFQMASHELKTPVTSMKAYAQFLYKRFIKNGDEASASFLAKMSTQISKLEVLIKDLLDINRIEGGKLQFNESAFSFNNLVVEVVEEMQRTTNKKLIVHVENSPIVWGDKDRIGQVLTNFISNAIKYSPKADHVEISTFIDNHFVICSVTDFGIGIPEEQQQHVFDRFYRVSGQNTDTFPGLGLGLYISSEIIKRQNGTIWVSSKPQEGSDFCFRLPLIRNEKEDLRS